MHNRILYPIAMFSILFLYITPPQLRGRHRRVKPSNESLLGETNHKVTYKNGKYKERKYVAFLEDIGDMNEHINSIKDIRGTKIPWKV